MNWIDKYRKQTDFLDLISFGENHKINFDPSICPPGLYPMGEFLSFVGEDRLRELIIFTKEPEERIRRMHSNSWYCCLDAIFASIFDINTFPDCPLLVKYKNTHAGRVAYQRKRDAIADLHRRIASDSTYQEVQAEVIAHEHWDD